MNPNAEQRGDYSLIAHMICTEFRNVSNAFNQTGG